MHSSGVLNNKEDLSSPLSIISIVEAVISDVKSLCDQAKEQGSKYVSEESTTDIIVRHTALLGRLVPIRTDKERVDNKNDWDAKEATKRLIYVSNGLKEALEHNIFRPDNARDLYNERAAADEDYKAAFSRLEKELPALARLHMSTIGSSHRLPTNDSDSNNDSLAHRFGQLVLEDADDEASPPKDTICIFDESGCIPSYELLGLTRLGRPIVGLVLVGDKHQLPPYDPGQGRRSSRGRKNTSEKIRSLLDTSALTSDSGKVMLTTQYRVPKDVADILNHRVYRGQYNTCPDANVPLSGLRMVDVSWSEHPRRKYVNPNEVQKGIALLRQLTLDYEISNTLVITPVRSICKGDNEFLT